MFNEIQSKKNTQIYTFWTCWTRNNFLLKLKYSHLLGCWICMDLLMTSTPIDSWYPNTDETIGGLMANANPLRPVSLHSRFLCLHLAPYPSYIHDSSIVTGEGLVNQVTEILEDLKQRGIRIWMLDPKGMPLPEGMHSIEETMNNNLPPDKEELESNPPRSVRQGMTMKDPFAYIYTSGTTGKIRIHAW